MAKLISFKSYLDEKLKDPEFVAEFETGMTGLRFAASLALLRERRGMTKAQLAELVEAKQPMIARYEKGQIPSVPMLRKLTHALGAVFMIKADGSVIIEPAETQSDRLAA